MIASTVESGTPPVFNDGPRIITPGIHAIIWSPTSRLSDDTTSDEKNPTASRTYPDCFIRGVREQITIIVANDAVWEWRRIVFEVKNPIIVDTAVVEAGVNIVFNGDLGGGYRRLTNDMGVNLNSVITQGLFKGQAGTDWSDPMVASVDTTRVTLHTDKTFVLKSGNSNGHEHRFKFWYPCNKKLIYNDDEQGTWQQQEAGQATLNRIGMGDLYIYDYFSMSVGPTGAAGNLFFRPQATFYWHERS